MDRCFLSPVDAAGVPLGEAYGVALSLWLCERESRSRADLRRAGMAKLAKCERVAVDREWVSGTSRIIREFYAPIGQARCLVVGGCGCEKRQGWLMNFEGDKLGRPPSVPYVSPLRKQCLPHGVVEV